MICILIKGFKKINNVVLSVCELRMLDFFRLICGPRGENVSKKTRTWNNLKDLEFNPSGNTDVHTS